MRASEPLRVLVVEDSEDDAALLLAEMRRCGFDVQHRRVESEDAMKSALDDEVWDLVTCDYVMPHFSGPSALKMLQSTGLDLPFIVVSGKVGEETAVEMLKAGAHDFIVKGNFARLIPAIRRELREARIRRERALAQSVLEQSEARFHSIARVSPTGIFYTDGRGGYIYVNERWCELAGMPAEAAGGDGWQAALHAEDRDRVVAEWRQCLAGGRSFESEHRLRRPDGATAWVIGRALPEQGKEGEILGWVGALTDITQRKQAESALDQSERRFRSLIENAAEAFFLIDAAGKLVYRSESGRRITGFETKDVIGRDVTELLIDEDRPVAKKLLAEVAVKPDATASIVARFRRADGGLRDLEIVGKNSLHLPEVAGIVVTARDITERRASERALNRVNQALRTLSACNEALVRATDEGDLLKEMCRIAVEVGGYKMAWVGFAEYGADKAVRPVAQGGMTGDYLERARVSWDAADPRGRGPAGTAIREGMPTLVSDTVSDPRFDPWRTDAINRGYRSVLALPLKSEGRAFGALIIYSEERNGFDPEAIKLLNELADDLAFGIVTVRARAAYEKRGAQLQRSLHETIQGIAATVDKRDPYTAGHQRRVAELADEIARDLGLPEEQRRGLHLAGVVHDVGKIQIPTEILTKPAKLSDPEFRVIMGHPQAGYDILKDIDFPWPIAEIVRQHHERLDGSGYPRRLKGDDILIEARILAVADVVEAMAAPRPYRAAPGIERALAELGGGRGPKYDAAAVDACLRLFKEKGFAFSGR